ncbi:MAG TPA: hypothetical protein VII45_06130 [Solirubrobacterales bacterium]
MQRTGTTAPGQMPAATRIAWWAFFAVPVALLVVLLVARPAAALTLHTGPNVGPALSLPSDEEEDEGEEESEEEELEDEAAEEEELEDEEGNHPPAECLLQTARAQAFAYPAQDKVRLLIHYTSTEPTEAAVAYRLTGDKGALKFAAAKQRLGNSGAIRLSESLSTSQASKVSAANSFTVEVRIPATPHSCRRFDTRHLTIEHGGGNRLTWLQSESVFGA